MRIYVPLTPAALGTLRTEGKLSGLGGPLAAHAVTGAVREWYTEGELEELEYTAMVEAAEACLSLMAADPSVPRLRLVVAADVPDGWVRAGGRFRSSVSLENPLELEQLASLLVDEPVARATVTAAVGALDKAANGDDDAQFLLDEAEGADLLWYDVSEIGDVAAVVSAPE